MLWRIGLVCFVLLAASPAPAHDDHTLDPRNATPGLRLGMTQVSRLPDSLTRGYRLQAVGFPRGVVLSVWAQDFGQPFRLVASGFEVDGSGNLVWSKHGRRDHLHHPKEKDHLPHQRESDDRHHPNEITFEPGPYPRAAVWRVALVSVEGALKAFAAVIPYPITARQGPCTVSLELVSYRGDHFVVTGAGFAPGEEIVAECRYSGRSIQKRQRASPTGLLPLDVISHEAIDADRSARYTVKGRSCELSIEYDWGKAALLPR